jgi:hypothetical protein
MQTGTASACRACVMACEQGGKRERSDNNPKLHHERLPES